MVWGSNTSTEPLLTLFAANALVARTRASPGSRFLQIVDNFILISSSFPKTWGTVETLPKKAMHQVLKFCHSDERWREKLRGVLCAPPPSERDDFVRMVNNHQKPRSDTILKHSRTTGIRPTARRAP